MSVGNVTRFTEATRVQMILIMFFWGIIVL